jgi:hypothetical protein
MVMW